MTTPYERGKRMERQAVEDLRKDGYEAQRTAGSHSPFDVVAWTEDWIRFIQVKRAKRASDVTQAVLEARDAWQDHQQPRCHSVITEVWVRYQRKWHKFCLDEEVKP